MRKGKIKAALFGLVMLGAPLLAANAAGAWTITGLDVTPNCYGGNPDVSYVVTSSVPGGSILATATAIPAGTPKTAGGATGSFVEPVGTQSVTVSIDETWPTGESAHLANTVSTASCVPPATTTTIPVKVPSGKPMIGGTVSCKPTVQTLTWWVHDTSPGGTVSAWASTGQSLPVTGLNGSGSFTVHGPEIVTLTEENTLNSVILKSSSTVDVPADSTCDVATTTTTTVPATTTTQPPTPSTTVVAPAPTTVPRTPAPTVPVVAPKPLAPVVAKVVAPAKVSLPVAPSSSLADTGAPSLTREIALAALAFIVVGWGLVKVSKRQTKAKV